MGPAATLHSVSSGKLYNRDFLLFSCSLVLIRGYDIDDPFDLAQDKFAIFCVVLCFFAAILIYYL